MPYSDTADPQTLNLYGYVRNLPTVNTDVDGHCLPYCAPQAVNAAQRAMEKLAPYVAAALGAAGGFILTQTETFKEFSKSAAAAIAKDETLHGPSHIGDGLIKAQRATDRGRANEAKGLEAAEAKKNTKPVTAVDPKTGKETTVIHDGVREDGQLVEVKDRKYTTDSGQLRTENEVSTSTSGKPLRVIVPENGKVSKTVERNYEVQKTNSMGDPTN